MIHRTFRSFFCFAFSAGTPLALAADSPAPLTLDQPVEWQVVQRDAKGEGMVPLSGSASPEIDALEFRLLGKPLHGMLAADWSALPIDVSNHRFEKRLAVPGGGWYRLEVRALAGGKTVAERDVERLGIGEVFVIAGQSNAGNYGSEKQNTKTGLVARFDGKVWDVANDPQRGAGGNGGSFMAPFGDALVAKLSVPIGLVPLAVGSTSVREWLPKGTRFKQQPTTGHNVKPLGDEFEATGLLFDKLAAALTRLSPKGCRAVLWHQGESDVGQARGGYPADRQITGAQYAGFMETLIRASRERAGWNVPWLTAVTTYHSPTDARDEEFRAAQQSLWSKGLSLPGPDTDTLGPELRAGVHLNGAGLRRHGELWAEQVLKMK